jgi:hypothetical protein
LSPAQICAPFEAGLRCLRPPLARLDPLLRLLHA